jgi:hypothetical protein
VGVCRAVGVCRGAGVCGAVVPSGAGLSTVFNSLAFAGKNSRGMDSIPSMITAAMENTIITSRRTWFRWRDCLTTPWVYPGPPTWTPGIC